MTSGSFPGIPTVLVKRTKDSRSLKFQSDGEANGNI